MVKSYVLVLFMLFLSLLAGCAGGVLDNGVSFSVGEGRQVLFAPGNLAEDGGSFVEHQWERGGLFGWGTGNRPLDTTDDWQAYVHFVDWGDCVAGGWRTLTAEEWHYLLFERPDADEKRATGTVNGRLGLLLLPDEWEQPEGCPIGGAAEGWEDNSYTVGQWERMEKAGAVFLPASGFRWGAVTYADGCEGLYWSSTIADEGCPYTMHFDGNILALDWDNTPHHGQSVRLARERKK